VGAGHGPLALLFLELGVLVDEELAILGERDLESLERSRRGSFDVDPRLDEAASVARTLELLVRLQPVRRATEVRAGGREDVETARLADDPVAARGFVALVDRVDRVLRGVARL